MERHLDDELQKMNANLLKMAAMAEEAIHNSIEALKGINRDLAEKTIANDVRIDELENKIEEEGVELLALFQPMAKDLRFISTGLKINTELERIADLAVNICQRVQELADLSEPLLKPLVDIPQLTDVAKAMVRNVIDAFVRRDEGLAKGVILSDKEANRLRTAIITELVDDYMVKDGSCAPRAMPLLLVARDLERICDHATYIAEDVIYMIHAKVVKHHPELLKNGDQ